jgi:hypothetical protein
VDGGLEGGRRGVTRVGRGVSSTSSTVVSLALSRDIRGTSSLLRDLLRVWSAGEWTYEGAPLNVFARDPRVAARRDMEERRSRTKEFVSGS